MTTPNQVVGNVFGSIEHDLAAFIGQGAYQVGNAAQNWGQHVTEEFVRVLTLGPGAIVADAFSSVEGFLAALEQFLLQLPLEALQMFRRYIPGALEAAFETIEGAVLAIMGFFNGNGALVYLKDLQNWLTAVYNILQTEVHQFFDVLQGILVTPITSRVSGFLDWYGIINLFQSDVNALKNVLFGGPTVGPQILGSAVQGLFGSPNIVGAVQQVGNYIYQGLLGLETLAQNATLGQIASAAGQVASTAQNGQAIGVNNSTVIVNYAVTQPLFMGGDPTASPVFPILNLTNSSPTFVNCSASTSVMGFLTDQHGGSELSITWWGENTTNVTSLILNLYKLNVPSQANYPDNAGYLPFPTQPLNKLVKVLSSNNRIGAAVNPVGSGLAQNYFNFSDASLTPVVTNPGDQFAVEMVVQGTGTYQVLGLPNHWFSNNGVFPSYLAASRNPTTTPSPATLDVDGTALSYSSNIPWFSLCGKAGVSQLGTLQEAFVSPGTYTFPVPTGLAVGDKFDIVLVGGGAGGGTGGVVGAGNGGQGGIWYAVTLVYGVDVPIGTTTFTVNVGSGGGGTPGGAGGANIPGGNSSGSSVTIPGYTGPAIATGGSAGGGANGGAYFGNSPGNETFDGKTYFGGATQNNPSGAGISPGGGGAGGYITGFGAPSTPGGAGAPGAVWITVYRGHP